MKSLFHERSSGSTEVYQQLGALVPLLDRIDASGLPPAAIVAMEAGDSLGAGKILSDYDFGFVFNSSSAPTEKIGNYIQIDISSMVPKGLRSISLLGLAAIYFTFFTSYRR
ncbi:hypothetical protein JW960_00350 [candidate division KSB1 bacterium]|nr:hypothetical protein [candidate division KSB1 bacterium]